VPIEEDAMHEFKGHRSFHMRDVNPRYTTIDGRATRKASSTAVCGMLNRGTGGTLYLGILDDGRSCGLMMSNDQREHILCSVVDTMKQYQPPVPK
jgi:hypothetical protein